VWCLKRYIFEVISINLSLAYDQIHCVCEKLTNWRRYLRLIKRSLITFDMVERISFGDAPTKKTRRNIRLEVPCSESSLFGHWSAQQQQFSITNFKIEVKLRLGFNI
jgi:hypothetical protein